MDLPDRSQHKPGYAAQEKERNTHRRNAGNTHGGPLPGPGLETDDKPAG